MNRPLLNLSGDLGSLIVLAGCTFSGKTDELITQLNIVQTLERKARAFIPSDRPIGSQKALALGLRSHDGRVFPATPIGDANDLLSVRASDLCAIAIDDAHFLNSSLPEICATLAQEGFIVLIAGRDRDSFGHPIKMIGELMALADQCVKKKAVCQRCTLEATFTQLVDGSVEEPWCRRCFTNERPKLS